MKLLHYGMQSSGTYFLESLFQAYFPKDALRNLWTYIYPKWADKYPSKWISWENDSEIQLLIKFAKGLNSDRKEILACINHRSIFAKLEAFNGTINSIFKRAFGYRDMDYL